MRLFRNRPKYIADGQSVSCHYPSPMVGEWCKAGSLLISLTELVEDASGSLGVVKIAETHRAPLA